MKKTLTATVIFMAFSSVAFGSGYKAWMKLGNGIVMMVMDHAVSCSNGPIAIILGPDGKRKDMTCNVQFTSEGVRTLFSGYGKPVFWSKDQFQVVPENLDGR